MSDPGADDAQPRPAAGDAPAATELQPASEDADALALQRAERAWAEPFLSAFARCPRCGERFPPEVKPPSASQDAAGAIQDARAGEQEDLPPCPRCQVAPLSAKAGAKLVPHGSWSRELLRGASYLPRGAFHVVSHPRLWKWAAIPTLLNIMAVGLAFAAAWLLNDWLQDATSGSNLADWTGWLWGTLYYLVKVLGTVAGWLGFVLIPLLTLWLFAALPFAKILFMPFMELLAEGTEQVALGIDDDSRFDFAKMYANVVIAVIDAIFLTMLQGVLFVLLLPLNLIPIAGQLLWLALPPAIFAGMDYSDLDLVRRSYTTREKGRLWKHHHWRFLGYGLSFCFLITLPIVNLFAIPAAAAGGSLLYLELDRK